jgi:hypothetical protein
MSDRPDRPPPGWYSDPLHNKRERYWDGEKWEHDERASPVVTLGYFAAVFLPVVGFAVGVWVATRPDDVLTRRHGPYLALLSIACAAGWAFVFTR